MGQLFFKKALQDAIREGRKRATIRRWARPLVRAGEQAYAPGVGWLRRGYVKHIVRPARNALHKGRGLAGAHWIGLSDE